MLSPFILDIFDKNICTLQTFGISKQFKGENVHHTSIIIREKKKIHRVLQ